MGTFNILASLKSTGTNASKTHFYPINARIMSSSKC